MKKNKYLFVLLLVLSLGIGSAVLADDDEDEYDDDDREEYVQPVQETPQPTETQPEQPKTSSKPKTIKQTITDPSTIIKRIVYKKVTLKDSDLDGIPDQEDAYPMIAQIYIVNDANGNGIDDKLL